MKDSCNFYHARFIYSARYAISQQVLNVRKCFFTSVERRDEERVQ